ncbi:hypothetical protein KC19_2G097100 [Ceratodon purpureus]|uniref:Secreted protein n=1 Tax=Ceratodon purpureus TaxID=3225 RepID=A0A8T0ITU0_CERPU|nr:hypothetical protein KC19_2G096700 [Ceratodon purpureus]KAG0586519.1 hypothetical protein KC19_2G097100 [Ceratodon purpureus]
MDRCECIYAVMGCLSGALLCWAARSSCDESGGCRRSCCIRVYGAGLHSGIIHYDDVKNQLHDLSGITEGAFEGNGRGRQACTWNLELNCLHTAAYE